MNHADVYVAPWLRGYKRFNKEVPFRKVIDIEFYTTRYNRPGEGSKKLILECGHYRFEKQSYPTPKRARCSECKTVLIVKTKEARRAGIR